MRGKPGQPLGFFSRLLDRAGMAREPNGQLLAQPVDHMVRAGRGEQKQRQLGPLRELRIDQTPRQRGVDCRGCLDGQEQLLWVSRVSDPEEMSHIG